MHTIVIIVNLIKIKEKIAIEDPIGKSSKCQNSEFFSSITLFFLKRNLATNFIKRYTV